MPQETLQSHNEVVERAKGFLGGTASGLTKLAIGHPFVGLASLTQDTVKVRLQCSPPGTYLGMVDCVRSIVRSEGVLGVYKGCLPPALGWIFTDSILLGSLHTYRTYIARHILHKERGAGEPGLPMGYQVLAGMGAGWTNSLATTPVELLKTKLQMQKQRVRLTQANGAQAVRPEFTSTFDCARQIVHYSGVRGLWHALPATLLFRSSFGAMFGSYDYFQRKLGGLAERLRPGARTWYAWALTPASVTFFSGGLAAEVYWLTAYPADVIKNRLMADSLQHPKYPGFGGMFRVALELWTPPDQSPRERGLVGLPWRIRRIYTGYLTCALRAFPTNAGALLAFESVMYLMNANRVVGASAYDSEWGLGFCSCWYNAV